MQQTVDGSNRWILKKNDWLKKKKREREVFEPITFFKNKKKNCENGAVCMTRQMVTDGALDEWSH